VKYFPVFFDLAGQTVLVVGGGEVALRKVALLLRAGAQVRVVAPHIEPALAALAGDESLTLFVREFVPDDLCEARLVVVATDQHAVNRFIATLCEARRIPVNVVDDRAASRFIVPALIDRDPVLVAVSTGGSSPVLARRLREKLEALVAPKIGAAARWLDGLRPGARRRLRDTAARRRYFESLVDGAPLERFLAGDESGAQRLAQQLLFSDAGAPHPTGHVTLVGAGPGDPDLLTLKALRALQDADVILYDRLVSAGVLDMARRDAKLVCVGKSAGSDSTAQADINALLIEQARRGLRVVRLKGGDPFMFGRGGEELQALAEAKIDFSVIPGITAAAGCAAYAGIPLTHREHAQSVSFVTGHADRAGKEPDWRALCAKGHTAVFYMGLGRLEHIVGRLLAAGADAGTPAALIASGTLPQQRVVAGTLADLVARAARAQLQSPSLLIVGEVVALQSSLGWFGETAALDESRLA
jgi:uroporphyrin-III C-methyltransferase/precorrin-2 dehydrogenase/sirohydrochlorin ferrochelatase